MEGDYDRMESFPREFHNIVEVPAAGSRADLFKIAENSTNPPAIGFDCGTEDWLIDSNRKFHAHLEKLGIPHEFREHPGGHDWTYWDAHIREAFEFHAKNLGFTGPNG
jgi:S-formylglutathione hydrolase FrmB